MARTSAPSRTRSGTACRADPRRADDQADAGTGQEARHGDGRADLRRGPARRLLQHRSGDRCRRHVSRQVSQDAHPALQPGFWEKFYFRPGNLGYPVFETRVGKVGVYICYDRHFPDGARVLGLNGAEIVFNPSATVAGLSEYLWKLEQPAHAVANSISSARSIGRASRNRGKSASSTVRAISAIRAASSSPRPARFG